MSPVARDHVQRYTRLTCCDERVPSIRFILLGGIRYFSLWMDRIEEHRCQLRRRRAVAFLMWAAPRVVTGLSSVSCTCHPQGGDIGKLDRITTTRRKAFSWHNCRGFHGDRSCVPHSTSRRFSQIRGYESKPQPQEAKTREGERDDRKRLLLLFDALF
jgi:hypothetical protein